MRLLLKLNMGNLSIADGLRAMLALGVPLWIGKLTNHQNSGLFVGMMAFSVNAANVRGSYHTKALVMLTAIAAITISVFVGTLAGSLPPLAVLLTFLWGLVCGLVYLYGEIGLALNPVVGITFVVALNKHGDYDTALMRVLECLMAGGWTMLLCLVMWPFTPYSPLQVSVAACYRNIANYLKQFSKEWIATEIDSTRIDIDYVLNIRRSLDQARTLLGMHRQGQKIRSWMDEQLLILIQDAERLFCSVTALTELIEVNAGYERFSTIRLFLHQAVTQMVNGIQAIATTIAGQSVSLSLENLHRIDAALREQERWQKIALSTHEVYENDYTTLAPMVNLIHLVEKVIGQLELTIETAKALQNNHKPVSRQVERVPQGQTQPPPGQIEGALTRLFTKLRDNVTLDSAIFRYAVRLGVTLAIGVVVYTVFDLYKGYWIVITMLLVLRPDFGSTVERFLHRVAGTVLGAIIAAILLVTISNDLVLNILLLVSVFIGFSLRKVHYGYAVIFLAIFVLLLTSINTNNPVGWEITQIRIVNTLIGAGLAIIAHGLLWPDWERQRYSNLLAHAVRECRSYFETVMAVYLGERENKRLIPSQKRQTGIAILNAQASCQRLLGEPQTPPALVEALMTVLVGLGRFNNVVTVLNVQLDQFKQMQPLPELVTFVEQISLLLDQIAEALKQETSPPDLPDLDSGLQSLDFRLKTLHTDYLQSLKTNSDAPQVMDIYSVVKMEIEQMVRWITALHSGLVRLYTTSLQKP